MRNRAVLIPRCSVNSAARTGNTTAQTEYKKSLLNIKLNLGA